jgi:hypothetical protein
MSSSTERRKGGPGRWVGSGGQFLALASADGLLIIDMTCGRSNTDSDRELINLATNGRQPYHIIDVDIVKIFILYSDGVNVAVVRANTTDVNVSSTPQVCLSLIGSSEDPMLSVIWYPQFGHQFSSGSPIQRMDIVSKQNKGSYRLAMLVFSEWFDSDRMVGVLSDQE